MTELDTRSRILAAARHQVAATGPAALRVDSVARAAGVNKRMIYHWFGDREGLVTAAFGADAGSAVDPDEAIRLLAWQALEGRLVDAVFPGVGPLSAGATAAARDRMARALALRFGLALFGPLIERAAGLEPKPWRERLAGWDGLAEADDRTRVVPGKREAGSGVPSLQTVSAAPGSSAPQRRPRSDDPAPELAPAARTRTPKPRVRVQPRLRPQTW